MKTLYVLYDRECSFCDSCRSWLCRQATFVELRFLPSHSPAAAERFPDLAQVETGGDLVVISDEGAVYRGTSAYLMCLYALKEYREWALRRAATEPAGAASPDAAGLSAAHAAAQPDLAVVISENTAAAGGAARPLKQAGSDDAGRGRTRVCYRPGDVGETPKAAVAPRLGRLRRGGLPNNTCRCRLGGMESLIRRPAQLFLARYSSR